MTPDAALPTSLISHRPFVLFWLARTLSTVALQMQAVAVAWQMYDLTRKPLDLGFVGLAQFIPALLLSLLAGHLADRHDRRVIVSLCQIVAGLAITVLAAGTAYGWLSRNTILAVVFVLGATRAFESTTLQTLVPAVVPQALVARATAASSSATQLAVIAGPAIGGLFLAVSPLLVYALCCTFYVTAAVLTWLIPIERPPAAREPLSLAVLFAGVHHIRQNRIILGVISLDLFAVVIGGVTALLPIFANDVFGLGPEGLGQLRAAPGVGALIVAIAMTRWSPRRAVGRTMFIAVAAFGAAILVFGLSRSFLLSLLALSVLGAADMVSVVIRMTLVQLESPDAVRGRVSAVNSLFVQASNQLGEFRAGLLASWIGTIPTVLIGGVGTLLVVLASRKIFAELYNVDAFERERRR